MTNKDKEKAKERVNEALKTIEREHRITPTANGTTHCIEGFSIRETKTIQTALKHLEAALDGVYQPIESAPRDKWFIAMRYDKTIAVIKYHKQNIWRTHTGNYWGTSAPTHWKPIDTPADKIVQEFIGECF